MRDSLRRRLVLIVGGYCALSGLWILFSDRLVLRLTQDPALILTLNTSKGWFFVATTALLLYGLLRRRDRTLEERQASVLAGAEELKAIFDAVNEAIIVHARLDARIVDCNHRACEMFGYTREQLMGCLPADLAEGLPPYDEQHAREWEEQSVRVGPQLFEWRSRRRDGTCFWSEISLRSSTIGGGARVVAAIRDITDRKRAEEDLRRSEECFANVFRTSPDGMAITRLADGVLLDVNQTFLQQTGYSREEVIGRSSLSLNLWVEPELRQQVLQKLAAKEETHGVEVKVRRKDGSVYLALWSASSSVINGEPCMITVSADITANRAMDDVIRRAQRLESLGVLAGGIAHDFNNLLAGVFGYLDLAREALRADKASEAEENLSDALSVFGRARALTQQLLTFAKGGAPVRRTLPVAELVRKAVTFATSGSNCRVSIVCAPDTWYCDVDENQLGQVIDNLAINAKQAMPRGGQLEVRIENVAAAAMPIHLPAQDHVHLVMRDSGQGISPEHLQRIFDPFFTTKPHGSGLGLATSYSIIHKHDGHIEAESEVGVGAVFHVWLPRTHAREQPTGAAALPSHHGQGRVLIMDDESFVLDIAGLILRGCGYQVSLASHGDQAVAQAEEALASGKPFRAALLDMTIPGGLGGKEIVHRLKMIDPSIKVLASSGYTSDEVMARPMEFGFDGSLAKPYVAEELRAALAKVLPS